MMTAAERAHRALEGIYSPAVRTALRLRVEQQIREAEREALERAAFLVSNMHASRSETREKFARAIRALKTEE